MTISGWSFWTTFQSSPFWIEALWLVVPLAVVPALVRLIFRWPGAPAAAEGGKLLYKIHKETNGLIQVHRHGELDDGKSELVLIEHQLGAEFPRLD